MVDQIDAQARLLQAYEYLRSKGDAHSWQDIALKMKVGRSYISDVKNDRNGKLTEGFLRQFAKAYPQINADYLIEGKGELVLPDPSKVRPHIPIRVAAGFTSVSIGSVTEDEVEHLPIIPGMPSYDFSIRVEGDSMEPEMHDGDTLLCSWLDEPIFDPRRYYVLDTTEGPVVKSVEKETDTLLCRSLNPAYPDFHQPLDTILRAATVRAVVRKYR